MNSKINPALYKMYLRLHDTLGAEMVHRRRRASSNCIEVIFHDTLAKYLHGRLNTLKEAESCGYWVICRLQNKRGHKTYHGKNVYQLFLSPVHPKKRREVLAPVYAHLALTARICEIVHTDEFVREGVGFAGADRAVPEHCRGVGVQQIHAQTPPCVVALADSMQDGREEIHLQGVEVTDGLRDTRRDKDERTETFAVSAVKMVMVRSDDDGGVLHHRRRVSPLEKGAYLTVGIADAS